MRYSLTRETDYIKEWQTPWGRFVDSKFRWLGTKTPPAAATFVTAWDAANDPERLDLEDAFAFFPYELAEDVEQILAHIARHDPQRANRMRDNLFGPESELTMEQQRFLSGLREHLLEVGAPMELVGENQWFGALKNDGGFHIETKVASAWTMPTEEDLRKLLTETNTLAYQRIIRIVIAMPELLRPRDGEQAFPGLG